jgi:ABC-type multidrug transport system ATPase subunit
MSSSRHPQRRSGGSRPGRPERPASASTSAGSKAGAPSTEAPRSEKVAKGPKQPSPTDGMVVTVDLTKDYGGAAALSPLTLVVPEGQRVALVGHNGSGKTTLIRLLTGMLDSSGGTASIGGDPTGSPGARAALSYLADQPVFYDDLSVWEHLEYVARLHGAEEWEQQAADLLEMVGLTPRADDLPITFSRGLKQKAAICLAFVRPFDLMLVDEPFVGLDRAGREALLELFRRAHADGATLMVATHELTTVTESDRVIALRDGEVIFDGSTAEADLNELVGV